MEPYELQVDVDHFTDGARTAGLPEQRPISGASWFQCRSGIGTTSPFKLGRMNGRFPPIPAD
jgi:hypothetical protein